MKFILSNLFYEDNRKSVKIGSVGIFSNSIDEIIQLVESGEFETCRLEAVSYIGEYPFISDIEYDLNFKYFYLIERPKEKEIVPYTWDDRYKLRGGWFKEKSNNKNEQQITKLYKEKGIFFINDIPADEFLENYEWLGGNPCGIIEGKLC